MYDVEVGEKRVKRAAPFLSLFLTKNGARDTKWSISSLTLGGWTALDNISFKIFLGNVPIPKLSVSPDFLLAA